MRGKEQKNRPPEGTVRAWKVAEAKRKIAEGLDQDPVAIAVTAKALLDELCPDKGPLRKKRPKLAS